MPQDVPEGPLRVCLDLPEATPPKTNKDLLEGFITAREGHEVCRGVVQGILDTYTTNGVETPMEK